MNPHRIGTPMHKIFDEWHFHFSRGDTMDSIVFDIQMRRPRDIEDEDFKFHFLATIGMSTKEATRNYINSIKGNMLLESDSISGLRDRCADFVAQLQGKHWHKIIAVYAESNDPRVGKGIYNRNAPVFFDWGVGYQSENEKWFRKEMDSQNSFLYEDAGYLTRSGHKDGKCIVHPWSQELEDSLKLMDEKFKNFGDAMSQLVKSGKQLVNSSSKMLGEGS
jgi:hypothetical protein